MNSCMNLQQMHKCAETHAVAHSVTQKVQLERSSLTRSAQQGHCCHSNLSHGFALKEKSSWKHILQAQEQTVSFAYRQHISKPDSYGASLKIFTCKWLISFRESHYWIKHPFWIKAVVLVVTWWYDMIIENKVIKSQLQCKNGLTGIAQIHQVWYKTMINIYSESASEFHVST